MLMNTFGDRFRAARNALGLTQDELAERLELTKSAISAWENNREAPSFDKLSRVRTHLETSLDYLICGEATAKPAWEARAHHVREPPAAWEREPGAGSRSRDEVRLLRRFRAMNERKRKALIVVLDDAGA
jgi:transcriptional regulator with XRE-family HTH domain